MEAIKESREHSRYRIAYRIYCMLNMMEKKSYSIMEMASELGVTKKTTYRMMNGLESMGVPFYEEFPGRYRIIK